MIEAEGKKKQLRLCLGLSLHSLLEYFQEIELGFKFPY